MAFYPVSAFINSTGGTLTGPLNTAGIVNTGTITSTGGISTSGLQSITSSGNFISNLGDLDMQGTGHGLKVKEGSNAKQGVAVLVAGAATVANTSVTANSRILVTSNLDGGTPGWIRVSAITPGTSFVITSSSGTDTSTVAYEIFEPG